MRGGSVRKQPAILPFGQSGVLTRFADATSPDATRAVQTFADAVRGANLHGVVEVAPSLISVLVRFDPAATDRQAVTQSLNALAQAGGEGKSAPATRRWLVPAAFGGGCGPQLAEFAQAAGRSETQLIKDITGSDLHVLAIGFAPGQPYLGLLPPACDVARQQQLTPRVPAGTLAAALRQLVLFVNDSPTGWRAIGQTAFRPFLRQRSEPFLLRPGDALRLQAVSEDQLRNLWDAPDGLGGAKCKVTS